MLTRVRKLHDSAIGNWFVEHYDEEHQEWDGDETFFWKFFARAYAMRLSTYDNWRAYNDEMKKHAIRKQKRCYYINGASINPDVINSSPNGNRIPK